MARPGAQLGVEASSISVRAVENLQWSNGAIGCPRPDMGDSQAIVPGDRVVLEHAGKRYAFHRREGKEPEYCASPG